MKLKVGMNVLIKKSRKVENNKWYTIKEILNGKFDSYLYCTRPKICVEYNGKDIWLNSSCVVESKM